MHRSDVLRRVARTYPVVCRPPMRLVASSRLSCHWLVNALLRDLGGDPVPVAEITAMVGEGAAVLVRRCLPSGAQHIRRPLPADF